MDRKNEGNKDLQKERTIEMKKYVETRETIYVEQYEFSGQKITRLDYDFKRYCDCSTCGSESFYASDNSEFFFNIHALRIA